MMKTYGGTEVKLHIYLTMALVAGEWPVLLSGHLIPEPINSRKKEHQSQSGCSGKEKNPCLMKVNNCQSYNLHPLICLLQYRESFISGYASELFIMSRVEDDKL
jgi:hypothetical protein